MKGYTRKKTNHFLMHLTLIITISLILSNAAFCKDNYTLSISCVVPEIPGVNAPLIQENKVKKIDEVSLKQNAQELQRESESNSQEIIQKETKEEIPLSDGKNYASVLLETLYSR